MTKKGKWVQAAVVALLFGEMMISAEMQKNVSTTGNPGAEDMADATVDAAMEQNMETTEDAVPGWKKDAEEEVTLDWYINFSWFCTGWGENLVSKTITEETGVSVNFITPMGNENEKLNALIASGALPDLITLGWWEPQVGELITGDMLYPLNELADTYDTYFWDVTNKTLVKWYTREDGNIYCYPNSAVTPGDIKTQSGLTSNETFLVRKDIYEALGCPDMTTPEGFASAVKKAVELYPEVNGEPLIPIGAQPFDDQGNASFDKYLMDFLAIPWEKDNKMYDRYTDPEYIAWLKVFRQLGEEGYLASDIFVDSRTQMEEKLSEGRYFCMIYQYSDMEDQQKELYEKNPDQMYIAVEGPRNSNGDAPTLPTTNANGWTVTMISKDCKNPKRAIQFLDYLMSEQGQKRIFLGVEGETYDEIDGVPVLKEEVKEILDTDRDTYNNLYGADDTYWMLQNNVMQLQWKQETSPAIAQMEEWADNYVVYNGQYEIFLEVGSKESTINGKICRLWSKVLQKLLLAPSEEEFDRILADFVEQREKLGFEELMEVKTQYMIEAKEKLELE